jgi:ketosteroid isomerase-like protein
LDEDKVKDLKIEFTDSLQVEESFYQAFQNGNIKLMRDVWDKTDEVVCIHPAAQRIYSYELIIASWEQIFTAQEGVSILVNEPVYKLKQDTAIHYVKEELYVGESSVASILATNIYQQTSEGWKMIAHHASAASNASQSSLNPSLH